MAFFKSMATVSGLTFVSRILGYGRDALIAATFGKSGISDVFFVAFQLPNTFRRLMGEGALTSAFVPLFTHIRHQEGKEKAAEFASQVITILASFLIALVAIFEVAMPTLMRFIGSGFQDVPSKMHLAIEFSYITFPYVVFICLVAIYSGILNAMNRFLTATASPIILNIFMIGAMILYNKTPLEAGYGLTYSVLLAGIAQLIWVMWAVHRTNLHITFPQKIFPPHVKTLLYRMGPGLIGAGVYQINMLISNKIATHMPMAVSYLNYADRITQFPLSMIGAAMGVVLLPLLSNLITTGQKDSAIYTQNRAIQFSMLLTLPAATAFITISLPIVKLLYQYGKFTPDMAAEVAWVLSILATGLPAYVMVKILISNFFARGDTKTPVKAGMIAIIANIFLNIILFHIMGYKGIAAGNALSSWINVLLLLYWLHAHNMLKIDRRVRQTLPRVLGCCGFMGWVLYEGAQLLLPYMEHSILYRVISVFLLMGTGLFLYTGAVWITRSLTYEEFQQSLRRLNKNSESMDS